MKKKEKEEEEKKQEEKKKKRKKKNHALGRIHNKGSGLICVDEHLFFFFFLVFLKKLTGKSSEY